MEYRQKFKEARRATRTNPKEIVSDGTSNFAVAINDGFPNSKN
jgi:hypothetical protein